MYLELDGSPSPSAFCLRFVLLRQRSPREMRSDICYAATPHFAVEIRNDRNQRHQLPHRRPDFTAGLATGVSLTTTANASGSKK
jgi:hypothetical protein